MKKGKMLIAILWKKIPRLSNLHTETLTGYSVKLLLVKKNSLLNYFKTISKDFSDFGRFQ